METSKIRASLLFPRSNPILLISQLGLLGLSARWFSTTAFADEHLFGWVLGAETLPSKHAEAYEFLTLRTGKAEGTYLGWDSETEMEYGFTDQFRGRSTERDSSEGRTQLLVKACLERSGVKI